MVKMKIFKTLAVLPLIAPGLWFFLISSHSPQFFFCFGCVESSVAVYGFAFVCLFVFRQDHNTHTTVLRLRPANHRCAWSRWPCHRKWNLRACNPRPGGSIWITVTCINNTELAIVQLFIWLFSLQRPHVQLSLLLSVLVFFTIHLQSVEQLLLARSEPKLLLLRLQLQCFLLVPFNIQLVPFLPFHLQQLQQL